MPKGSQQAEFEALLKLLGAANGTIGGPDARPLSTGTHAKAAWIKAVEDMIPLVTFLVLLVVLGFILWIIYLLIKKHLLTDEDELLERRAAKLVKRPAEYLMVGPHENELQCHHCKAINTFPNQFNLPIAGSVPGQIADSHLGGSKPILHRTQELEWEITQRHTVALPKIRAIQEQPSSSSHKEQTTAVQPR